MAPQLAAFESRFRLLVDVSAIASIIALIAINLLKTLSLATASDSISYDTSTGPMLYRLMILLIAYTSLTMVSGCCLNILKSKYGATSDSVNESPSVLASSTTSATILKPANKAAPGLNSKGEEVIEVVKEILLVQVPVQVSATTEGLGLTSGISQWTIAMLLLPICLWVIRLHKMTSSYLHGTSIIGAKELHQQLLDTLMQVLMPASFGVVICFALYVPTSKKLSVSLTVFITAILSTIIWSLGYLCTRYGDSFSTSTSQTCQGNDSACILSLKWVVDCIVMQMTCVYAVAFLRYVDIRLSYLETGLLVHASVCIYFAFVSDTMVSIATGSIDLLAYVVGVFHHYQYIFLQLLAAQNGNSVVHIIAPSEALRHISHIVFILLSMCPDVNAGPGSMFAVAAVGSLATVFIASVVINIDRIARRIYKYINSKARGVLLSLYLLSAGVVIVLFVYTSIDGFVLLRLDDNVNGCISSTTTSTTTSSSSSSNIDSNYDGLCVASERMCSPLTWILSVLSPTERYSLCIYFIVAIYLTILISSHWVINATPTTSSGGSKWSIAFLLDSKHAKRKLFHFLAVALFVPPVLLSQSYYSSYSNDDTISAIDKDSFDDMTTDTAYNRVVVERLSFVHLTQAVAMCILLVIEIIRYIYMNARKQAVEKSSITSNVIKSGVAEDATQLDFISSYFQPFLDDRDIVRGIAVTHIYLLIACAVPLAMYVYIISGYSLNVPNDSAVERLSSSSSSSLPLLPYLGCILIGIGDSFGAIIGSRFGATKWGAVLGSRGTHSLNKTTILSDPSSDSDDTKHPSNSSSKTESIDDEARMLFGARSVEGSLAFVGSTLVTSAIILAIHHIFISPIVRWGIELVAAFVALITGALLEAFTSEIDNLYIPIVSSVIYVCVHDIFI